MWYKENFFVQKTQLRRIVYISILILSLVAFNLVILSLNNNFTTYEGTINLEGDEKMFYIAHIPKGEGNKPLAIRY